MRERKRIYSMNGDEFELHYSEEEGKIRLTVVPMKFDAMLSVNSYIFF